MFFHLNLLLILTVESLGEDQFITTSPAYEVKVMHNQFQTAYKDDKRLISQIWGKFCMRMLIYSCHNYLENLVLNELIKHELS